MKSPKIAFNMKNSPYANNLDDLPSVRLREERSYEYKKKEITVAKVKGITYFKSGSDSEKSGFFVANGRVYTISVTGTAEEFVSALFDEVISSVSFLNK